MKRTALKRSTKPMARIAFKQKGLNTKRKKRPPNRQKLTKAAKKRVWELCRKIVILRDGGICITCGVSDPPGGIHTHHWIVFAGSCARTKYMIDNLTSLCYSCHKFKIHLQGDAATYDTMRAYMLKIIGIERYEEIKAMKFGKAKQRNLEDYLILEMDFKMELAGGT